MKLRHRVFVYGTLKKGGDLSYHLLGTERIDMHAKLEGYTLYGWGVPKMVPDGSGHVEGEVYGVSDERLAVLDHVEGHPRIYKRTMVELADGTKAWAYVWQMGIHKKHEPLIGSKYDVKQGRWRGHVGR